MDGAEKELKTVQILNKLFGAHSRNLERAMDATSQRAGTLTRNLANVNVPGYKREDQEFAIQIEGETQAAGSRLRALQDKFGTSRQSSSSIRVDGNSVDLETEVMAIAEMEMRYQMMSEVTSRYFSGLKSVIREGR